MVHNSEFNIKKKESTAHAVKCKKKGISYHLKGQKLPEMWLQAEGTKKRKTNIPSHANTGIAPLALRLAESDCLASFSGPHFPSIFTLACTS